MLKIEQALELAESYYHHLYMLHKEVATSEDIEMANDDFKILTEAQQELADLKDLLKSIEWAAIETHEHNRSQLVIKSACPVCHGNIRQGHSPGCKLAKLINGQT